MLSFAHAILTATQVRKNEEIVELRRRDKSLCGKSAGFVIEGRRVIQEGGMQQLETNLLGCSNLTSNFACTAVTSSLGSEPSRAIVLAAPAASTIVATVTMHDYKLACA